ncbi:MAG TPA: hypothetical protein PK781_03780, partial [Terrimesophilobacter sp.]|nr:hypothetical protein [Terrimesophilobacter sp.]
FASDEEALAAAVEVYEEYLAAIQQRSNSGVEDLSVLSEFVTEEQLARERAAVQDSLRNGTITKGEVTFERVAVQQRWVRDRGVESLITYLCLDVSNVVVLNSEGVDVTPLDRPNRVALEVEFLISGASPVEIKIARSEVWPDQSYCE